MMFPLLKTKKIIWEHTNYFRIKSNKSIKKAIRQKEPQPCLPTVRLKRNFKNKLKEESS